MKALAIESRLYDGLGVYRERKLKIVVYYIRTPENVECSKKFDIYVVV